MKEWATMWLPIFFVILGGLKVGLRYGYPMKHLAVR
jgi:hypothetical protein